MRSDDPAAALGASERDALDRLIARLPVSAALTIGGLRRIPLGSSLRRRLLSTLVERVFAAMVRSDVDLALLIYEPDAELWMSGMSGVGIGGCYRGHGRLASSHSRCRPPRAPLRFATDARGGRRER